MFFKKTPNTYEHKTITTRVLITLKSGKSFEKTYTSETKRLRDDWVIPPYKFFDRVEHIKIVTRGNIKYPITSIESFEILEEKEEVETRCYN